MEKEEKLENVLKMLKLLMMCNISMCQGPYRHYVLNAIWILINLLAIMLTIFHLR